MSSQGNIKNLTLEYLIPISKVISIKAMSGLSKGLARAKGLTTFSLTNSDFDTTHLKLLFTGICNNRSLSVLSLAYNKLDDSCGTLIGKIISTQGFLKDELVWLTSLRNEVPKTNLNDVGINTVILDGNKSMGIHAIRDMCAFIKFDTWFRSLSLNNLDLSKESLEVIVDCLDKNKSIIMLGLEDNKRLKPKHIDLLNRSLARNINEYTTESRKEKTIRKALKKLGGKGISETDFQNFESPTKSLECSMIEFQGQEKLGHVRTSSHVDASKRPGSQLRPRTGVSSSNSKPSQVKPNLYESSKYPYNQEGGYQSMTATSIGDAGVYQTQTIPFQVTSGPESPDQPLQQPHSVANLTTSSVRHVKTEGVESLQKPMKSPGEGVYRFARSTATRERVMRQNSALDGIRRPHPSESQKRGPLTELVTQSSFDEQMLSKLDDHINQVKYLCQMMPLREADTKMVHDSIENISTCVDKMKSCGKLGPEIPIHPGRNGHQSNILSISSPQPLQTSSLQVGRVLLGRSGLKKR